ncbi:MAG TPA: DedA family protein [Bryobacteraceae bacterium]
MHSLPEFLSHYGYTGLFGLLVLGIVGLPVPDETLLVLTGYLISQGHLHPVWAFVAAFGGSACGITISYILGRTLGYRFVTRYGRWVHLTEERVEKIHHWFNRLGHWLLAVGYFIPGVRHFTAFVAGTSCLEYPSFALFAYLGAFVWVSSFLALGYFVGEKWESVLAVVDRYLIVICVAVAIAGGIFWWWRLRKRKQIR